MVSIGIPSKEAKTEIEINPVTAETKIRKCSKKFRVEVFVRITRKFSLVSFFN